MKIFLLANHNFCLPMVQALAQANLLCGVACNSIKVDLIQKITSALGSSKLPLKLNAENWEQRMKKVLKRDRPDVVFVMTFKHKIPKALLSIPKHGFINFHPGPLPKYKGADPVFWQIKNAESEGTLTIHQMDENYDTGSIITAGQFPITQSMTHSRFMSEAGMMAVHLVSSMLQAYNTLKVFPSQAQNSKEVKDIRKPSTKDFTIDWKNQTAEEIVALVNACNASYGGAIGYLRNQPLQILQVSKREERSEASAGMITAIGEEKEWLVSTKNGHTISIDIVQSGEGIMTGVRFAGMAQLENGESFS